MGLYIPTETKKKKKGEYKMMEQIKKSFRNRGTWVSMLALIGFFCVQWIPGFDMGNWEVFVELLLAVVAALGIISNPQDGDWFIDENENGIDDRLE